MYWVTRKAKNNIERYSNPNGFILSKDFNFFNQVFFYNGKSWLLHEM